MTFFLFKSLTTIITSILVMSCSADDRKQGMKEAQIGATKGDIVKEEIAVIETEFGDIKIRFYRDDAPGHTQNFLKLAREGFFDSTTFHRVINQFMIQGGDPNSKDDDPNNDGQGGPGYTIKAEIKRAHKYGAVAGARQGDHVNPTKASSGSQFYIVQRGPWTAEDLQMLAAQMNRSFSEKQVEMYTTIGGTPHLDNEYSVFGEVIEGMDVVNKIALAKVNPWTYRPVQDVLVKRVYVQEAEFPK